MNREVVFGTSMAVNLQYMLGKAIVGGDYDDKEFPNEAEIAKLFGASRPVTREAVKMLTAKGLVSSRQKKGTYVLPVSEWNLLDPDVLDWLKARRNPEDLYLQMNEMRLAFEPVAASLAARCPDRRLVDAIGEALEGMYTAQNPHAVLRADISFHVAILKASRNPFFWRLKPIIHHALDLVMQVSDSMSEVDIPKHEAVYMAIARNDAELAEEAMRNVLRTLPKSFSRK